MAQRHESALQRSDVGTAQSIDAGALAFFEAESHRDRGAGVRLREVGYHGPAQSHLQRLGDGSLGYAAQRRLLLVDQQPHFGLRVGQ